MHSLHALIWSQKPFAIDSSTIVNLFLTLIYFLIDSKCTGNFQVPQDEYMPTSTKSSPPWWL